MISKFGLIIGLICLTATSHQTNGVFEATEEWQEIREGQKVPGGLHYRMNLATGKKEAKILIVEEEANKDQLPVVVSSGGGSSPSIQPLESDKADAIRQKVQEKLNMNKDIEQIKTLVAHFSNSSTTEQKVDILEHLDDYLHQIDNARDFVTIGGLSKVVIPALNSKQASILEKTAILIGSASQANTQVQDAIIKTDILTSLLDLLVNPPVNTPDNNVLARLMFAISSLVRGNAKSMDVFDQLDGFTKLSQVMALSFNKKLVLKGLTLVSDVLKSHPHVMQDKLDMWCPVIRKPFLFQSLEIDHIEKVVDCLLPLAQQCKKDILANVPFAKEWLGKAKKALSEEGHNDEGFDFHIELQNTDSVIRILNAKDEL